MWLIGQEWKYSNVCSGLILIGRGLDQKDLVWFMDLCEVLKVQKKNSIEIQKINVYNI